MHAYLLCVYLRDHVFCADHRHMHVQRQLAAQMLHQQQLLQRAAAQHQQAHQEGAPAVWHPPQGFAKPLAASAAMQQLPHQEQPAGQAQDPAPVYEQGEQ